MNYFLNVEAWKKTNTKSARKICIWSLDYSLEQRIVCPWGDNLLFAGKKAHKLSMIKHLGRAVSGCFNSLFLVNLMNSFCLHSHLNLEFRVNYILPFLLICFITCAFKMFYCWCLKVISGFLAPSQLCRLCWCWAEVAPSRVAEPSRGEGTRTVQQPQDLPGVSKSWPWGSCKDFCKGSALRSCKPGVFHVWCR